MVKVNKKYLPLLGIVAVFGLLTGVVLYIRGRNTAPAPTTENGGTVEVALNDRPVTSLTPSADGHWLTLSVEKITIKAETMDYELLYQLPDGRTQGVPGTVEIKGEDSFKTDPLLLGSESSGKYRYDEGVEEGQLTLRFRDGKGKLITRFTTKFSLQSGVSELTMPEEEFSFTLKAVSKDFFVTMGTFGIPSDAPGNVVSGPFGIFSSATSATAGTVEMAGSSVYMAGGSSWNKLESGEAPNIGIFLSTSE